jgi:DNA-binding response OmpR family regulator
MSQGKIAVVDDDPMIRFLVQEYLKAAGFEVDAFDGGKAALAALANLQPNLVVLDLQMPEMNGFEVLQKLRQDPITAAIPVLMLSANASEAQTIANVSANAYLEKPFQMQELLAKVESTKVG